MNLIKAIVILLLLSSTAYACDGCIEQAKKYGVSLKEIVGSPAAYRAIIKIHEKLDELEERIKKLEDKYEERHPDNPLTLAK